VDAKTRQKVFEILADQMHNFALDVFVVLPILQAPDQSGDHVYSLSAKERTKERAIDQWVYDNGQIRSHETHNPSAGRGYYSRHFK
jgi:hypothetical protein